MTGCLADAEARQPKAYPDHCRDSAFPATEPAIKAYEHWPADYRERLGSLFDPNDTVLAKGPARFDQRGIDATRRSRVSVPVGKPESKSSGNAVTPAEAGPGTRSA